MTQKAKGGGWWQSTWRLFIYFLGGGAFQNFFQEMVRCAKICYFSLLFTNFFGGGGVEGRPKNGGGEGDG